MCGIAGYFNAGEMPDRASVRRMCDRIVHRGPDADGYYFDKYVALGHRRLSIIDLSGGAQPLGNEDGSVQVVFNGEIYNYLELRRDLEAKGHRFSTHSDTEVLVHLYEEAGERLPEFLNGMFAFAIWDAGRRTLFLARDRFGKKPLYYTTAIPGLRVAFASELKALAAAPGFDAAIEPEAVADFLSLGYVPDPRTIYKNVHKLGPGSSLMVTSGAVKQRRYWSLDFCAQGAGAAVSETDAIEQIRSLAIDSVERRLISDVPLGAFLSGGVDSSAVVAAMSKVASGGVRTFSIGFTSKEFDELRFARMVANRHHTEHREHVVTPQVHEMLDKLVEHYDEPFGDASAIPTMYLSRMTRQYVTVALSGDGADEAFGGYRRYSFGVIEERIRRRMPEWFRNSVCRVAGRYYPKFDYLPQVFRAKTLLHNLSQQIGDAYFTSMSAFRDAGLQAALSPQMAGSLGGYDPRDSFRGRFEKVSHMSPLRQMQSVDFETYLPGDILVKMDRATMAYSLESRSPWLDYRLVEKAAALPDSMLIRGGSRKDVFKKAFAADIPEVILTRPKMGFVVPLAEWFRGSLKPSFESLALRQEMTDYFSLGEIQRLWTEHQSGFHNHERKLWNVLMLAAWDARHRHRRSELFAAEPALAGR